MKLKPVNVKNRLDRLFCTIDEHGNIINGIRKSRSIAMPGHKVCRIDNASLIIFDKDEIANLESRFSYHLNYCANDSIIRKAYELGILDRFENVHVDTTGRYGSSMPGAKRSFLYITKDDLTILPQTSSERALSLTKKEEVGNQALNQSLLLPVIESVAGKYGLSLCTTLDGTVGFTIDQNNMIDALYKLIEATVVKELNEKGFNAKLSEQPSALYKFWGSQILKLKDIQATMLTTTEGE